MELFGNIVEILNGWIWSKAMLVLVVGTGIIFSLGLGFFQFTHHKDMWSRIIDKGQSEAGISTFASFCTTMAARIGTGNVAGVSVAIYHGGPGALFWMWVVGCTNAALAFVECTLGQLYKIEIDGEYRCSGAYCAERGLGWKKYGTVMALLLALGAGLFMPAAATYTIADGFKNALNIPMPYTAAFCALALGIIIIGGIKRIGQFASKFVPFMTVAYILMTIVIIAVNIKEFPRLIVLIFESAFNKGAIMGGIEGGLLATILQGVKRGTFSSAAGMGESTPAASAAETTHPVKQGLANAAGVFLDTIIVCSATGFMVLISDCYNTSAKIGGHISSIGKLAGKEGGVIYVQQATEELMGSIAPVFIAVMLFLFSFTCLISYYYESETSALYLFQGKNKEKVRTFVKWAIRVIMVVLVFIWGIAPSSLAWNIADFALGLCTWVNVIMLWFLFPKARALYKDYRRQMDKKQDPFYNPNSTDEHGHALCWNGVDKDLWLRINRKNIK